MVDLRRQTSEVPDFRDARLIRRLADFFGTSEGVELCARMDGWSCAQTRDALHRIERAVVRHAVARAGGHHGG